MPLLAILNNLAALITGAIGATGMPVQQAQDSPHSVVTPAVFAPGVLSGPAHDSAPAFSPAGDEVYFGRSNSEQSAVLVSTRGPDGQWTEPRIAPFSGAWNDMEPAMSPDGRFLVFVSNRPDRAGGDVAVGFYGGATQKGGRLWRVERRGQDWGEPTLLPANVNPGTSVYAPSVAADGSLYFMTPDTTSGRFRLFRAQLRNRKYLQAQPLPFSDGKVTDVDPAVAPDESYLVFGSGRIPGRGIDLFIAFRDGASWTQPVHLGDAINTPKSDAEPRLSPDAKVLYFSSERTLPVEFPRAAVEASMDVARMQSWDNGNYNIWWVPLESILEQATKGAAPAQRPSSSQ
jgi:hypothetical protein